MTFFDLVIRSAILVVCVIITYVMVDRRFRTAATPKTPPVDFVITKAHLNGTVHPIKGSWLRFKDGSRWYVQSLSYDGYGESKTVTKVHVANFFGSTLQALPVEAFWRSVEAINGRPAKME
jgi:hypothetical protein